MKDRTNEEPSDPVLGSLPDDAKWPGCGSTQHGGKHDEVQDETETWLEQMLEATKLWIKLHQGAEGKLKAQ
jgi:hypothetical protein